MKKIFMNHVWRLANGNVKVRRLPDVEVVSRGNKSLAIEFPSSLPPAKPTINRINYDSFLRLINYGLHI